MIRRRIWVAAIGLVLMVPLLSLFGMSAGVFSSGTDTLLHFFETVLPDIVLQTLVLCAGIVLLTSSMGVLSAWWVSSLDFPGRRWIEFTLLLPMAMPSYVIAYAYTDALQFSGPIQTWLRNAGWANLRLPEVRSLGGAICVLAFVLYPYVYLLVRTAFSERSATLLDAARTLGCNPAQAFFRVALPVARPAVVAGLALVLMETLAEYGALSYFGVQTFTTAIFRSWLNMGDRSSAAFIALLLLILMVFLMSAESWARGQARFYSHSGRPNKTRRKPLKKLTGLMVSVLCLLPSVLGFFAPVVFLLRLVHESHTTPSFQMPWLRFFLWAWHSVSLGLIAAAVALLLSVMLGYARRQDNGWLVRFIHRAVSLGYGVPGAIIAIAILIPLSHADVVLTEYFHLASPLLAGGVMGLIYAYTVRFTSASLQSVDTGLQRITPFIDDSARTLGCSARQVWWRVHLPILRGSLGVGGLLVLVDVMKELPVTLVLRPFDFDTLAVVTHQFATDERLAEAALPALTIVLVALVPMLLLIKQSSQK